MKNRIFFSLCVLLSMSDGAFGAEQPLVPFKSDISESGNTSLDRPFMSFVDQEDIGPKKLCRPGNVVFLSTYEEELKYARKVQEQCSVKNRSLKVAGHGKILQIPDQVVTEVIFFNDLRFQDDVSETQKFCTPDHGAENHIGDDLWVTGCDPEKVYFKYTPLYKRTGDLLKSTQEPIIEIPLALVLLNGDDLLSRSTKKPGTGYLRLRTRLINEKSNAVQVVQNTEDTATEQAAQKNCGVDRKLVITYGSYDKHSQVKFFLQNMKKLVTPASVMLAKIMNTGIFKSLMGPQMVENVKELAVYEKLITQKMIDADGQEARKRLELQSQDDFKASPSLGDLSNQKMLIDHMKVEVDKFLDMLLQNEQAKQKYIGVHLGVLDEFGRFKKRDTWFIDTFEISPEQQVSNCTGLGNTPQFFCLTPSAVIFCYRSWNYKGDSRPYGFFAIPTHLMRERFEHMDVKFREHHGCIKLNESFIDFGKLQDAGAFINDLNSLHATEYFLPEESKCLFNGNGYSVIRSLELNQQPDPCFDNCPVVTVYNDVSPESIFGIYAGDTVVPIPLLSDESNKDLLTIQDMEQDEVTSSFIGQSDVSNEPFLFPAIGCAPTDESDLENTANHTPEQNQGMLYRIKAAIMQSSFKTKFVMGAAFCVFLYKAGCLLHQKYFVKNYIIS